MAPKIPQNRIFHLMISLFLICTAMAAEEEEERMPYIIHFDPATMAAGEFSTTKHWHKSILTQITKAPSPPKTSRIIYSYKTAINGFSAKLTRSEISELQNLKGFIAIYPDRLHKLQTTYSHKFLGLSGSPRSKLWRAAKFGRGTIIGVLDTGIWPESPSFSDRKMPPVPAKWKGECQIGADFNQTHCNRKLIGARFFNSGHQANAVFGTRPEYESPRDSQGHGTHTASTAAGSMVLDAGLFGNAVGKASGMSPAAHLAMYKVCWDGGCYSSDILAGIESAIEDGVDVISLSIGGFSVPFYEDSVAVGAFRAVERGVFVSCAAGNSGPYEFSVSNEAPWIMTVGAGTLDRDFPAVVRLGDGRKFYGESLFPGMKTRPRFVPLVYAAMAGVERNNGHGRLGNSSFCGVGSLDPTVVRGKFVICDRGTSARAEKGEVVKQAGGVGMILADSEINGEETAADVHVLPATQVGYAEAESIKEYIRTVVGASVAVRFRGTVYGRLWAPAVASFSSRGPSSVNPGVLKPDLIAPGVNILAAWPLNLAPSGLAEDKRRVMFNVISGTSMACPHVSGIAALIKSVHPDWSPAAIKSALMTTANVVDSQGGPILDNAQSRQPADIFATGAGHVSPEQAANPGLIYDTDTDDYIRHLCTLGYTQAQVQTITDKNVRCSNLAKDYTGLNYPSLSVVFNVTSAGQRWVKLKRTVTNVGLAKSRYSLHVTPPKGVRVIVKPTELGFNRLNEKKSYSVRFVDTSRRESTFSSFYSFSQGSLTWTHTGSSHNSSVSYTVRSPIIVIWST